MMFVMLSRVLSLFLLADFLTGVLGRLRVLGSVRVLGRMRVTCQYHNEPTEASACYLTHENTTLINYSTKT